MPGAHVISEAYRARQQVQSWGPGHSCGHLAAGTTPHWIRGVRAITVGGWQAGFASSLSPG